MERVLANIYASYGDCGVEFRRHSVLIVFGAPCQRNLLAGQEHGRTIQLSDEGVVSFAVLHNDPPDVVGLGAWDLEGYVRRRGTLSPKTAKTQQRKPTTPKRSNASKPEPSISDFQERLTRQTREL